MFYPRFLVISLGNPGPYIDTLHSAGHSVLLSLQRLLCAEQQPPFRSSRCGKKSSLLSAGPKYTLLQSPTLMNLSGPWVAKAWKETLAEEGLTPANVSLVLVHDDLEEDLGVVKLRQWTRSHRGHNGVKSVNQSLQIGQQHGARWARISVGIGRPEARDYNSVSDYVLRKMSGFQRGIIEDKATPQVLSCLLELEDRWRTEVTKGDSL